MKLQTIQKRIEEQGIVRAGLYYFCHFFSKASLPLVGKWTVKHRKICENRLVFKNRENQDFTDNARALFEYLVKNGYNEKYQIIYMVSEKRKFKNRNYKNVKFVTAENKYGWNSPLAYYYGATAKYFFFTNHSANLNKYHCEGQVTVNLWHGCGYKGAAHENKDIPRCDTMSRFDLAVVPGPVFVETKSRFWQCEKEKILPIGYPRYDWMLNPERSRADLLMRLFGWKDSETKAVIWMPTFRKSSLTGYKENDIVFPCDLPAVESREQLCELDSLCRKKNILLLIKKHPFQLGWSENEEGFTNIRYVTEKLLEEKEVFLYSLVGVCDGLLTDYSSIAVDFILLNRPIGFVLTDYELYEKARGFVFEKPLDYMPGEKIYNFTELQGFFEHVGDGKDLFAEERQRLLPVMHNPTENYSARLAETLHLARQEERQWQN